MKHNSLISLKGNKKVKVVEVIAQAGLERRLMGMGVYKGREITKLSHVGLKGPVVIKVGRTILALGHGVASKVIVE